MTALLQRWPAWYWLIVAYTLYVGIERWSYARQQIAFVRTNQQEAVRTPGYLAGARFRAFGAAVLWIGGGLLLPTGSTAVRWILTLLYLQKAATDQRDYASGFAEGRKSAELAAAWEYVRGRIRPGAPDRLAGLLFAAVTSGLPAFGLLVSIFSGLGAA